MKNIILLIIIILNFDCYSQNDSIIYDKQSTFFQKLDTVKSLGLIHETTKGRMVTGRIVAEYDCSYDVHVNIKNKQLAIILSTFKCRENGEDKFLFKVWIAKEIFYVETKFIDHKNKNLFDFLSNLSEDEKFYFEKKNIELAKFFYFSKVKKTEDFMSNTSTEGVALLNSSAFVQNEYPHANGFMVDVYNSSKKKIKQIQFYVHGFNASNKLIVDPDKKQNYIVQKENCDFIPNESKLFYFRDCWFTDEIEYVEIFSIKIHYEDGVVKEIIDINKITMPSDLKEYLKDLDIYIH